MRSWDLLDEVIACGVAPRRLVMRDAVGRPRAHPPRPRRDHPPLWRPYVVIHHSDLHTSLVRACRAAGVDLITDAGVHDVAADRTTAIGDHRRDTGRVVLAAGRPRPPAAHRAQRRRAGQLVYVAYCGTLPLVDLPDTGDLALDDLVVYVGPDCHLVQYPLRRGELFNQVAVFQSPTAARQ